MMKKNDIMKLGIPIAVILITLLVGVGLLGDDLPKAVIWWLSLIVLGIMAYPVAGMIFNRFHDGGFVFSKAMGVAFAGIFMWYMSSLKLMKFTFVNSMLSVLICFIIGIVLMICLRKTAKNRNKNFTNAFTFDLSIEKISNALKSEALFFLFFIVWCYLRGFKPEAYGTEKFMDFGFMAVMDRCDYMPPEDMWLANQPINYYYVGQYLATYITKLTGVGVAYGYNLMLMTLAAFGFTMPFSLVNNMLRTFMQDRNLRLRTQTEAAVDTKTGNLKWVPTFAGVVAGAAVSLAGNMHYLLFRYLVPMFQKIAGVAEEEIDHFWFPDSTRFIGYNPETADKTIHEFPSYSFVLGDLHAHVINIMFVMVVLAMLYAWLLYRKERMDDLRLGRTVQAPGFLIEIFHPMILVLGFFIGMFHTTNFWDFPIYFVVAGAVILFSNAAVYQFGLKTLILTGCQAAAVLVVSKIISLPFTTNFVQISTEIRLNYYRTPIQQLAILWGLPIVLLVIFLIERYVHLDRCGLLKGHSYDVMGNRIRTTEKKESEKSTEIAFKQDKNKFYQFIENLQITDLFVITIGLCAIGLIMIPETLYVKDIYNGDYKRSNTMFKLTYQAYIMFGICMSFILVNFLLFAKKRWQRVTGIIFGLCFVTTLGYFGNAVDGWFGNVFNKEGYKGLDATAFMEKESVNDTAAVKWLNENVSGTPVVLEFWGPSYSFYERISAISGLPTLFGWQTHEWLWRSDASGGFPAICDERRKAVIEIYLSKDADRVRELLEEYEVEYIYVGECERNYASQDIVKGVYDGMAEEANLGNSINETLLCSMGDIVFSNTDDWGRTSYLIKVSK